MTRVVTIANLKGGTGKSTTVAHIGHALATRGYRVSMVDADPQASLVRWAGLAGWEIPVIGLPTPTLHRQLWGVIDSNRTDVVLIDTPPLEEREGVVASALRIATDVIVPMAPTMMELDRIGPVWAALEAAAGYRDDDPRAYVLLTRTVPRASSTDMIRSLLTDQGHHVLTATVPRLERYAQAFGDAIAPSDGPYGAVVSEVEAGWSNG